MARRTTERERERLAEEAYRRGVALCGDRIDPRALGPGGLGWFARWMLGRAERRFDEALRLRPDHWQSLMQRGFLHQARGELDAALERFQEALALAPEVGPISKQVGFLSLALGRTRDAVIAGAAGVRAEPGKAEYWSNLAVAHCCDGNDAEAARAALHGAKLDPADRISARVLDLVRAVAEGKRPRPRNLAEVSAPQGRAG